MDAVPGVRTDIVPADGAARDHGQGAGRDPGEPRDVWYQGDGIRIHGLDWGGPANGSLMLLLHGFGGNARIWDDLARLLRAALPDHRLVGLDGRDGGDTDHPATGYERERFTNDILAVHGALGGEPMVLVAHSRAGWLAAWLAARHPQRVARLILVDPARLAYPGEADEDRTYEVVRAALGPFDSEAAALAWARRADPEARWTPTRTRSFLETLRPRAAGGLEGKLPPSAIDELRRARAEGGEVVEAASRISAPTLLLLATRQRPSRLADKLAYAERIPETKVVRIEGTHYLQTDAPDEVADAIVAFLRETD
jgi:pimeloyl-ACP methyl ester carboxylesterase